MLRKVEVTTFCNFLHVRNILICNILQQAAKSFAARQVAREYK